MNLLNLFFKKGNEALFEFPTNEKDIKRLKAAIQSLQMHEDPYIRTIATTMQKEPRRTQYLILQVVKLLSHAQG